MKLITLGTGTVAPHPARTAAAYWLEAGGVRLLMDCGAGTLFRLAGARLPWPALTHVALTHFHVDHWGELPHLLFAMRYGTERSRSAPLTLLGPEGLAERLGGLETAFGGWIRDPGYPLTVTELPAGTAVDLDEGVTLETCRTPHTPESLALAVRHGGRRLVYTGDTGPSEQLAAWAGGADLLVAECSLPEARAMDVHLTPEQAGALAKSAGVTRLVLSHFYPPVEGENPGALARAVFGGDTIAAADGDEFQI